MLLHRPWEYLEYFLPMRRHPKDNELSTPCTKIGRYAYLYTRLKFGLYFLLFNIFTVKKSFEPRNKKSFYAFSYCRLDLGFCSHHLLNSNIIHSYTSYYNIRIYLKYSISRTSNFVNFSEFPYFKHILKRQQEGGVCY